MFSKAFQRYRQPKAGSFPLGFRGEKRVKNMRLDMRGNTGAGVRKIRLEIISFTVGGGFDGEGSPGRHGVDGI